jgi:hypothetical protein
MPTVDGERVHIALQQARDGASVDGGESRSGNRSTCSSVADNEPPPVRQRQGTLPPPFKLGDDAYETLSKAFFEPKSFMAGHREELLAGKSVEGVMAEYLEGRESLRSALAKLSETLGVSFLRLREYYDAAAMATKQRLAEILFHAKTKCDFRAARIPVDTIHESTRPTRTSPSERLIYRSYKTLC